MANQVGIYKAKTALSSLIKQVNETGEPIRITNRGAVVAELHPAPKQEPNGR